MAGCQLLIRVMPVNARCHKTKLGKEHCLEQRPQQQSLVTTYQPSVAVPSWKLKYQFHLPTHHPRRNRKENIHEDDSNELSIIILVLRALAIHLQRVINMVNTTISDQRHQFPKFKKSAYPKRKLQVSASRETRRKTLRSRRSQRC